MFNVIFRNSTSIPFYGIKLFVHKLLEIKTIKPLYLISIAVCLPICDTVLFCNISALGQQLLVGNLLLVLGALLLHELLGGEDGLAELLRFQSLFALFVWHNLIIM